MILLACSNRKVLTRWVSAVPDEVESLQAESFAELQQRIEDYPESVVLIHFSFDEKNTIENIKFLHKQFPNCKIMLLEDVPNETHGVELIKAGILGYGNTYLEPSILEEAIKVVSMGEIWISKRVIQWIANHCNPAALSKVIPEPNFLLKNLTPAEIKIVNYLLDGDSNKTIARHLDISERTVKAHLTSIFRKTGIKDRLHLVLAATGKQH